MGQSQVFTNATYNWSTLGWSSPNRNTSRTGQLSTLAGSYLLRITQNGCERFYKFELSASGKLSRPEEVFITTNIAPPPPPMMTKMVDEFKMKAYPVPATNDMTIEVNNPAKEFITLSIVDLSGRVIYEINAGDEEKIILPVDVAPLMRGQYFIQGFQNGEQRNKPLTFIKQ
jgi:hypothetical protein